MSAAQGYVYGRADSQVFGPERQDESDYVSEGRLVGLTYWAVTFWSPAGASTIMRVSTNVMQKMTL